MHTEVRVDSFAVAIERAFIYGQLKIALKPQTELGGLVRGPILFFDADKYRAMRLSGGKSRTGNKSVLIYARNRTVPAFGLEYSCARDTLHSELICMADRLRRPDKDRPAAINYIYWRRG